MAQYIYGKNVVMHMMQTPSEVMEIYLAEGLRSADAEKITKAAKCPIKRVSRKELERLAKTPKHQGIVAKVQEYRTYSVDELLTSIPTGETPLLVMLDGLEDPHNLGAILRSVDGVGGHGVIIGKHRAAGLSATVAKVSAGAINSVKVAVATNLTQTLKDLKKQGFWVYGADMENAQDYRTPPYDVPLVLVIGSEGFGISRLVRETCDRCICLPMRGKVNSLNASVAAGILLYEVNSQRFPPK